MEIFFILAGLFPLVLIGGIVLGIVMLVRRHSSATDDPGIGTVRRLYFHIVSFVALMMATNGVVQIAQYVLESLFGDATVSSSDTRLAVGISLIVVGLPLWAAHWFMMQRHVRNNPVERRTIVRKLYTYVTMGVAVGISIVAAVQLLEWAFGNDSFSGYDWAAILVWAGVWAYHWRLESFEGQPTQETQFVRRLYFYIVSVAALAMLAFGFGRGVHMVLLEGYESITSLQVLLPSDAKLWTEPLRAALATLLVGGAVWTAHWFYFARHDAGSVMRQVYLYIFAVLGGAVTMLVGAGFIINAVLQWAVGAPIEDAASHFRVLPGAIASVATGAGLFLYHWMVVQREAQELPHEYRQVRRTSAYIMAALGLGGSVVAVGTVAHTVMSILTDSFSGRLLAGQDLWQEPIALSITLGILGLPIWGYYWSRIQKRVSLDDAERSLPIRRIFIFAALGVGALALLGSVSTILFLFLRDFLDNGITSSTVRDATPAIDFAVATLVFLPYYWLVYRQDRRAEPEVSLPEAPRHVRKEVIVLVSDGNDDLVRGIEAELGYRVSTFLWADPGATTPQLEGDQFEDLARRVDDTVGERVLLIPNGTTFQVLSYH